MLGAAGPAIALVFSLAALAITGVVLATFLSHYFLVSFEDTAVGEDTVSWLGEPIFDIIWKPVYLLGMLLVPIAPVGVVLVALAPALAHDPRGLIVFVAIIVWLIFPLLLLSSYFSGRWWSLHGTVILGLARNLPAAATCFTLSGILLAVAACCAWFALRGDVVALLTAAVIAGAIPLWYGRLLGRLAWLLDNPLRARKRKKRTAARRDKAPRDVPALQNQEDEFEDKTALAEPGEQITAAAASVQQPSLAIPDGALEDAEDEWDLYKKPYRMMSDAEVEIEAMKKDQNRDPGVIGALTTLPPIGVERKPKSERKKKPRSRFDVFFRGVWTFPFLGSNPGKWLNSSFLLLVFALILRILLLVWVV